MLLVLEIIQILFKVPAPSFGGWLPQLHSQFDGGVGHIVAAALQTKGIIDQAKILQNLTELNSIASLFYLFAIAMAVGSIAVFGNYRQGIYLLIGPALYTFMVTTTVDTDGIKAQMGDYEIPNSVGRQTRFLEHIRVIDGGGVKKVSLVYALVDGIATEVVQEITKLLVNTSNRDHLRFVARERALSYLLLDLPVDGALPLLVSRHQAECAEAMKNYVQSGVDTKKNLNALSLTRSDADVAKIKAQGDKAWGDEFQMKFGPGADVQIKQYLKEMSALPGMEGVQIDDPEADYWATCKDVWKWIGVSFQLRAEKAFELSYRKGRSETEDIDPDVTADLKEAITTKYLAAHMYKNAISQSSLSQLQSQMFSNSPINKEDLDANFRDHPGAHARGGYFGMKYFANSIPYLQGLLLYILSIGFPFFAILLVMPGKAMNFMLWVSLWVWVKSWDVGFALVLVCKDMFWHILKHRNNTFDKVDVDWADPSSVFSVILNNDPLATQNLYFELSSFLTVSVPFLTAHFCLGATGMFEMFRNSIDQTSQRFRTWEQKSGTRERLNLVEREQIQLAAAVSEAFAGEAKGMQSTGISSTKGFISGRGAQTVSGKAIGRDTLEALKSGENLGMIGGASINHTMAAYNMGDMFMRLGNDEFLRQYSKEMSQLDSLEREANKGLAPNAPIYKVPEGFKEIGPTKDPNKTTLDENVPKDILEKYASAPEQKGKAAIDVSQPISWRDFIKLDAEAKHERVVLPHIFRGMPRLESSVSMEQLRAFGNAAGTLEMVPGGSSVKDLVARGEQAEVLKSQITQLSGKEDKTDADKLQLESLEKKLSGLGEFTLESMARAGHEDFSRLVNYTGALSGRHYAPQIQTGLVSMNQAVDLSTEMEIKGRLIESGSKGSADILSNPFMSMFLNLVSDVDEQNQNNSRPGLGK